ALAGHRILAVRLHDRNRALATDHFEFDALAKLSGQNVDRVGQYLELAKSAAELVGNDRLTLRSARRLQFVGRERAARLALVNYSARGSQLRKLGFQSVRPYVYGKRTRIWVRGPAALPRHIEREGIRYVVGTTQDGRPQVTVRLGDAVQQQPKASV